MRPLLCSLPIALLAGMLQVSSAAPSQDSLDMGAPDSVYLKVDAPPDASQGAKFCVSLYCFNDQDLIRALAAGFVWSNPNVTLDSAVASATATSAFNHLCSLLRSQSLEASNKYRNCGLFAVSYADAGLAPSTSAQLIAKYFFSANVWSIYDSMVIDTFQFAPGAHYTAVSVGSRKYRPVWGGRLTIYDANRPCCVAYHGNVDGDPDGAVDVMDLIYLTHYLYDPADSAVRLLCPDGANVDGSPDGVIDISDLSVLIDYLYISFKPPAACQ
jgi:hypothetical protein